MPAELLYVPATSSLEQDKVAVTHACSAVSVAVTSAPQGQIHVTACLCNLLQFLANTCLLASALFGCNAWLAVQIAYLVLQEM